MNQHADDAATIRHPAMSGPASRQWSYDPAVSAVLAALEQAERRIIDLGSGQDIAISVNCLMGISCANKC